MYEGKTPAQTHSQVGTNPYESKFKAQDKTPDDFLWQRISHRLDRNTSAKY